MELILIGKGKMGSVFYEVALSHGINIKKIITSRNENELLELPAATSSTLCVHFATPSSLLHHVKIIASKKYPLLIGTTGWYENLPAITQMATENHSLIVYSSNFSPLILMLFSWCRDIGNFLNKFNYSIEITEKHHIHKKDAPSGTAITLAMEIIRNSTFLKGWSQSPQPHHIPIKSIREGDIRGEHTVHLASPEEELTILHKVKDRKVFAKGALKTSLHIINVLKNHRIYGCFSLTDFLHKYPY